MSREFLKKIDPSFRGVELASDIVQEGGLIVFPWGKLERRALAFMCNSTDLEACHRMNRIKTRPEGQVIAVNGYPQLIAEVAKVEDSRPLRRAAERLGTEPVELLRRVMTKGAVSFIFEARDVLPEIVTQRVGDKQTVMVAGEIDNTDFDFYSELVRKLHSRDVITAGSSANRTTSGTYNAFEQERAYADLADDVDLFVYYSKLPRKPVYAFNLESCITFDMTVDNDVPQVVRFGSVHPSRFKGIFGGYTVSKDAQYLPHYERPHHILMKAPFYLLNHSG